MALTGYGFKPIIGVAGLVFVSTNPGTPNNCTDTPAVPGGAGSVTDIPLGGVFRDLEVEMTDEQHIPLRNSANGGTIEGFMQGDRVTRIRFTFEPRASKPATGLTTGDTTVAESHSWEITPGEVIFLQAASNTHGNGTDLSALLGLRVDPDLSTAASASAGFHVLNARETMGENSARTFQIEAIQYEGTQFAKIS